MNKIPLRQRYGSWYWLSKNGEYILYREAPSFRRVAVFRRKPITKESDTYI